ncbi:MAG: acyltransferase [Anaerolineae bacterium]|nr:acyltransferase [Anaerolineae bacterium]MCO5207906.1 acyltransferase [Anaerolineae bacterium]
MSIQTSPQSENPARLTYMPGLDGIRAVAVLAVFFYHAGYFWAAGGFLGVESFFVISGYLISSLLLREYLANGRLDLKRFWLRRARRLLPALWLLLILVVPAAFLWAPDAWVRLREDIVASLFYVTNWVYIFRDIPYFEQFGRPPLLRHLWSLAVEEQFYLLWPLLLWLLLWLLRVRSGKHLLRLLLPIVFLAGAATLLMIVLTDPLGDPSRSYYGTDTRAAGFLLGGALALVWQPGTWKSEHLAHRSRRFVPVVELMGWGALIGLLILYSTLNEMQPWLYRGGFLLTAAVTCLLLIAVTHPQTLLSKLMGNRVLRWIGTRSYAIYLWHWVFMVLYRPNFECTLSHTGCTGVHLIATLVLAELSYRLVEQPIRQVGVRLWGADVQQRVGRVGVAVGVVLGLLLVFGSAVGLQQASNEAVQIAPEPIIALVPTVTNTPRSTRSALARAALPVEQVAESPQVTRFATPTAVATASPTTVFVSADFDDDLDTAALKLVTPTPPSSKLRVTLIGDSILGSTFRLWDDEWDVESYVLATKASRLLRDVPALIPELSAENQLAATVVIHLGTNFPFEPDMFDEVMQILLDHNVQRVLFVNIKRPVGWEYTVNKRLAEGVARWPEAELLDWNGLSTTESDWFVEDKTHLSNTGGEAYVQFIMQAVGG